MTLCGDAGTVRALRPCEAVSSSRDAARGPRGHSEKSRGPAPCSISIILRRWKRPLSALSMRWPLGPRAIEHSKRGQGPVDLHSQFDLVN